MLETAAVDADSACLIRGNGEQVELQPIVCWVRKRGG